MRLLSLDLAILLDVDVIVGLEDTDFVVWEVDTVVHRGQLQAWTEGMAELCTYVKPLIKVNSCLIVPPSALALSLALLSSSGEAFSFKVTCESQWIRTARGVGSVR